MHQTLLYYVKFAFVLHAFCGIHYHYYLSLILYKTLILYLKSSYNLVFFQQVHPLNMLLKGQIVMIALYHLINFVKESEAFLMVKHLKGHSFSKYTHPLILTLFQLFHWQPL